MEPGALENVMNELFLDHPTPVITLPKVGEYVLFLDTKEVKNAVERVWCKKRKAPGSEMVPKQVWRVVQEVAPLLLKGVFNTTLHAEQFLQTLKKAHFVRSETEKVNRLAVRLPATTSIGHVWENVQSSLDPEIQ